MYRNWTFNSHLHRVQCTRLVACSSELAVLRLEASAFSPEAFFFGLQIARGIKETAGDQNSSVLEQAEQAAALAKQAAPAPPVAPSTLAKPLVAPEPDMFSVSQCPFCLCLGPVGLLRVVVNACLSGVLQAIQCIHAHNVSVQVSSCTSSLKPEHILV